MRFCKITKDPTGEFKLEKFSKLVNLIEKKSEMVVAYHLKHSLD